MNIGQFVAAEIIILLVINSVEKIVVGLETLYDVLTAVEKIGQISDLETEPNQTITNEICYNDITLEAENINFKFPESGDYVLDTINYPQVYGALRATSPSALACTSKSWLKSRLASR
jgi:ABC-type bacteriocin/lantibiotic exporter with double-glycine peptidase domain